MDNRVALIGIMVENPDSIETMNRILHEYGQYIIGRMGLPYRERGLSIISIVLDAPMNQISSLSGKLGMLDGISTKTIYQSLKRRHDYEKFGSLLMSALLCASLLAGCSSSASVSQSTVPETISTAEGAIETGSEEVSLEEMTAAKTETSTEALEESSDDTVVRVGGLKGPTTMGLVKLMDDAKNGTAANNYEFTMVTAADELTGLVASGKVDIALLPANVASVLYHKTEGKVSVIDINTLGVLYLVSGDSSISSIENLSGKTVYLPGKGTTPEYVLRYLISASGLSDDAVTLEFKSEASEVAAVLAEDPNAIGLLPQPFVTAAIAQNDSLSVVLDLTKVWDSLQEDGSNSRLVTGVSIVNNEFLAAHKDLVDTFLTEHEASIAYTAADPEGAAALIEKAGIVAKAAIAQKALPACNITYLDGQDMKDALNGYLSVLLSQNPQSVGGSLPEDDFYYLR